MCSVKSKRIHSAVSLALLLILVAGAVGRKQPLHFLDQHGKVGAGKGEFRRGDAMALDVGALFEQLDELVAGEASALDDAQRQSTAQITVVPGHDHAATVAGAPQNNVAARLVVNLKASTLQSPDDLTRFHSGQAGHHAGSRDTLRRPTNCSSEDSIGIGSPCLSKLAQ